MTRLLRRHLVCLCGVLVCALPAVHASAQSFRPPPVPTVPPTPAVPPTPGTPQLLPLPDASQVPWASPYAAPRRLWERPVAPDSAWAASAYCQALAAADVDPGIVWFPPDDVEAHILRLRPPGDVDPGIILGPDRPPRVPCPAPYAVPYEAP